MKRGERFLTIIVLIALVSLWLIERPRITAAMQTVTSARRGVPAAPGGLK